MKKKHVSILAAVILLLSVTILASCSNSDSIELQYKDKFPQKISMVSETGKAVKISSMNNKYKLIFYLNSTSPDCIQRLETINKIIKAYENNNISYIILWEDNVPKDKVKNYDIDININYTLNNKYSLSKSKPNAFLLDKNNNIMRVTGYSYIDITKVLFDLGGKTNMAEKINGMILDDAFAKNKENYKKGMPTMLMFLSASCRLCKETEEIVKNNEESMQNKLNVISVRPDFDKREEYDINYVTDYSLAYFNVYNKIYNVNKFPYFVIIDKDNHIIKCFTDTNEMINYIKQLKFKRVMG